MDIRHDPPADPDVDAPTTRRGDRALLVAAAVVVGATATLAASILVPYVVNDLHRLPLAEVAGGAHDPKDLWPQGAVGGLLQLAGFFAIFLVLPGAVAGAAMSVVAVLQYARHPRDGRRTAAGLVLLLLSAALLVGCVSPLGPALASWRLD